jgi:hypothetical protein
MRSLRLVATQTRTVWFTDLQGSAAGSRWLGGPVPLTNLPAQVSSFIGRDAELAAVRALVAGSRLVTVTGMGGAGKTRLALQVAAGLVDGTGDGCGSLTWPRCATRTWSR